VLGGLAHFTIRHRRLVVGAWIVLTIFGAYAAKRVSDRWLEQFSIPGYSAYEANQRTLRTFGTGEGAPHVAVFTSAGDVTKQPGIETALNRVRRQFPEFRISSYFDTGSLAYVSRDRRTTFAEIYPAGQQGFNADSHTGEIRNLLKTATPPGVQVQLTGRDALYDSQGSSNGPSVFTEALIAGAGALVILLFVFGTLPAMLMPIMVAVASILNTFTTTRS
jgi:RND superfamily putative drug exporter